MGWKPTLKHCREYNITWYEHMRRSIGWSFMMLKASIALMIHSFFPWLFEFYASEKIIRIAGEMAEISKNKEQNEDI